MSREGDSLRRVVAWFSIKVYSRKNERFIFWEGRKVEEKNAYLDLEDPIMRLSFNSLQLSDKFNLVI